MLLDVVGQTEKSEKFLSAESSVFRLSYARQQDYKFVAAGTADGIRGSQVCDQALGNRHQQLIADRMTERVVDVFEAIHVPTQHCQLFLTAAGVRYGLRKAIL